MTKHCISSGIFDVTVVKNVGFFLAFQRFYALLLKHILNSLRNYLVLFSSALPILFVVVSLIIEQQIPKPKDSPPLSLSFDRYGQTYVPYSYDRNQAASSDFIRSYEYILQHAAKPPTLIDLSTNQTRTCQPGKPLDVVDYLTCIGRRSVLELSDQNLIGARVQDLPNGRLNLTGLFNNQPYHIPPLTLNYLTNALLQQYSSASMRNRTINVVNHPVSRR